MLIKDATIDDVETIAQIHVQAWQETYPGLLPAAEIVKRDLPNRRAIWSKMITRGESRIAVAPGAGFAQVGPQQNPDLRDTHPEELLSFYVLRAYHGKGIGLALLRHALGPQPRPFSALVLEGNNRACGFYEKIGMRQAGRRKDDVAGTTVYDLIYLIDAPDHIFQD